MTRIKLPILIGIVLVLIAVAVFLTFLKKSPAATTSTDTASSTTTLKKLTDDSVISPVTSFDNNSIWYFNSNGELFRRTVDGSSYNEFALPSLVANFLKASWPQTGDDVILVATGTTGESKTLYSNSAQKYIMLPQNIQSFDWMPDGKRIAYIWKSGDNAHQQLMVANSDASGYKVVADVFWPDLTVKVSPDGTNALLVRSNIQDPNKIYEVNLDTGDFRTVVDTGKNTGVTWIDASQFVYDQLTGAVNDLKVLNLTNNQVTDLGINTVLSKTVVDKQGKFLYASVVNGTTDAMWKVDLTTAQKSLIYQFDSTIHPSYLFMDDQVICFVNGTDGKLYEITQ